MNSVQKEMMQTVSPNAEPQNVPEIAAKTGNVYESLYVISKRANQMGAKLKEELLSKLEEFASTTDNLEEVFENREQIEISRFYEKLPHATIMAREEFMNDKTYFRRQDQE